MKYEVWVMVNCNGIHEDTGLASKLIGTVEANTFKEACDKLCFDKGFQEANGHYDFKNLTLDGRKLFFYEIASEYQNA